MATIARLVITLLLLSGAQAQSNWTGWSNWNASSWSSSSSSSGKAGSSSIPGGCSIFPYSDSITGHFVYCLPGSAPPDQYLHPNARTYANTYASALRTAITTAPGFDKLVPPNSDRSRTSTEELGTYSNTGTDVKVSIRFFKVEEVKVSEGLMRLKVWWRMKWRDDRLAWNASHYGGLTETYYLADEVTKSEVTEIWLPDIQPLNVKSGLYHTLEPSMAKVNSDGDVYWSRPGSLEIMCKFSGIIMFPMDTLKCKTEVGGWMWSGINQGILLDGPGYTFDMGDAQEETAGASYQEMSITNVTAVMRKYFYAGDDHEPWPVIQYTITLERRYLSYMIFMVVPGLLTTLLSFAVFWADTASADALGYGIGVLVVNLLLIHILIDILPVSGEMLWIDLYSSLNTIFCCFALMQSAFNIMVEQMEDDHLLPLWIYLPMSEALKFVSSQCLTMLNRGRATVAAENALPTDMDASGMRRGSVTTEAKYRLGKATMILESVAGVLYRQHVAEEKRKSSPGARSSPPRMLSGKAADAGTPAALKALSSQAVEALPWQERQTKLVFFESLFYKLDEDVSLSVDMEECDLWLSYAALDLDPMSRERLFEKYDFIADGRLNRVEFVTMCNEILSHVPMEQLQLAMDNMTTARKSRARRNRKIWRNTAASCDIWARYFIPVLYFMCLLIVFNLKLTDNYVLDDSNTTIQCESWIRTPGEHDNKTLKSATRADGSCEMFSGLPDIELTPRGWAIIILYIVCCVVVGSLWILVKKLAEKSREKQQNALKIATRQAVDRSVRSGTMSNLSKYAPAASPTHTRDDNVEQFSPRDKQGEATLTLSPAPSPPPPVLVSEL